MLQETEIHMNKTRLRKYARLIAKVGVNVQPGQEVIVTAELDQDRKSVV